MALLTDFFVAAEGELVHAFPGWQASAPAKQAPIAEKQRPAGILAQLRALLRGPDRASRDSLAATRINRFEHYCELKGTDLTQLAILMELMGLAGFEAAIDELEKPALFHPYREDEGLHRLPDSLTQALERLNDDQLRAMAARWPESDDASESDTDTVTDVLTCLRNLARVAVNERKHVYHSWSL